MTDTPIAERAVQLLELALAGCADPATAQIIREAGQLLKPPAPSIKPGRAKKPKRQSRADRWSEALTELEQAASAVESAMDDASAALSTLAELKQEYEDWYENTPDSLKQSPLGEKLEAITQLDVPEEWEHSTSVEDMRQLISDLEGVDHPLGFGRD